LGPIIGERHDPPDTKRGIDRMPAITVPIEQEEKVTWKDRCQNFFDAPRMAPHLTESRKEARKPLAIQIGLRAKVSTRMRLNDEPSRQTKFLRRAKMCRTAQ
jgi:hypothetical protein